MEHLKQTGRTTRMIEHAKQLDAQGRAVYIIAANLREVEEIKKLVGEGTGIKVETPDSPGNFSWETLRLQGAHPNCAVLVDHHAIEQWRKSLLSMLHAYDR